MSTNYALIIYVLSDNLVPDAVREVLCDMHLLEEGGYQPAVFDMDMYDICNNTLYVEPYLWGWRSKASLYRWPICIVRSVFATITWMGLSYHTLEFMRGATPAASLRILIEEDNHSAEVALLRRAIGQFAHPLSKAKLLEAIDVLSAA